MTRAKKPLPSEAVLSTERFKKLRLIAKLVPQKTMWVWDSSVEAQFPNNSSASRMRWENMGCADYLEDFILRLQDKNDLGNFPYILDLTDGEKPKWIPPSTSGLKVY